VNQYSWLIAVLPLVAALLIIFVAHKNRLASALISIGAVGLGFLYSVVLLIQSFSSNARPIYEQNYTWLKAGDFHFDFGILIDPLALTMLVVVTSVSLLVQIYSHGYMYQDDGYAKFYAFLSLFTASMLGLVISTNLFQIYMFWELVGLCSYLLIGFWNYKPSAAAAALKAFVVNRIGDCGLLLGLLLLAFATQGMWADGAFLGFTNLAKVVAGLSANNVIPSVGLFSLTTIAILMLLGPMAKSAQFPLHVWLPDAMEGPTPISALIHAATMVAAGVYLLARIFPIYQAAPVAMTVVAIIGATTTLFTATIALSQNDIKKALAYSTCSQLGYMVMSIGLGNWVAAMFHLVTHAFFKALLFLGSGSVIHGCHHEQDMRHFGGLSKFMPVTSTTFLIGTLAISGVPGLAGFWSKERIIGSAWELNNYGLIFWIAAITAGLTAFYMFRIYFLTFTGAYRGHGADGEHLPHESPPSITGPLIALAVPSVLIGYTGTHLSLFGGDLFGKFLTGEAGHHSLSLAQFTSELLKPAGLIPLSFSLLGILISYLVYGSKVLPINQFFKNQLGVLHRASLNKWYVDEIYAFIVQRLIMPVFNWSWKLVDKYIIDLGVNGGLTQISKISGWSLGSVQTGQTQTYIGIFVLAFVIITVLFVGSGILIEYQLDSSLMHAGKAVKP
jgi:proton-translocating NADH-quinone oxidoreductase chain L